MCFYSVNEEQMFSDKESIIYDFVDFAKIAKSYTCLRVPKLKNPS